MLTVVKNGSAAAQVDIYSFGVVLWEIVTQETGKRGHLRPTAVPEECPAEIETLIDRCTYLAIRSIASVSQSAYHACTTCVSMACAVTLTTQVH